MTGLARSVPAAVEAAQGGADTGGAVTGDAVELFANPEVWPFLLMAPLLGVAVAAARQGLAARAGAWSALSAGRVPTAWAGGLRLAVVTALLVLAWMDPRLGAEEVRVERRGVDVVVAVDVSRSMLARDLAPSRLERAKRDVVSILSELEGGDRIALVAFAGQADLLVPLTHDVATVRGALEPLDWDSVSLGGSDLAAALRKAIEAADPVTAAAGSAAARTAVVLLTDGEDHEKQALDAARAAAGEGLVVHAVGYGSPRGAKITVEDDDGTESFQTDAQGAEVVTSLDADDLREICERGGGGTFLRADAVALPLLELFERRIDPMAERVYAEATTRRGRPQFQWLLLAAVLLLSVEAFGAGGSAGRGRAGMPLQPGGEEP